MRLFDFFRNKIRYRDSEPVYLPGYPHEYCPRCEANITLQKGYSNELPYWICKGCGEMLISPEVDGDIAWICDQCNAMLNIQEGFSEECDSWACTECGFVRDIKPSNIIIDSRGEVFLLDINVAKWFKENEIEDTQLLGTQYYAAPEQLGYGFKASSEKSDIYAIGMILNVMVTGKLPKEEKVPEPLWSVVEKCINLNPEDRYTDEELISALDSILR